MTESRFKRMTKAELISFVREHKLMPISHAHRMTKAMLVDALESLAQKEEAGQQQESQLEAEALIEAAPGREAANRQVEGERQSRRGMRSVLATPHKQAPAQQDKRPSIMAVQSMIEEMSRKKEEAEATTSILRTSTKRKKTQITEKQAQLADQEVKQASYKEQEPKLWSCVKPIMVTDSEIPEEEATRGKAVGQTDEIATGETKEAAEHERQNGKTKRRSKRRGNKEEQEEREGSENSTLPGNFREKREEDEVSGVLELMPEGYGFLRRDNYLQGPKDAYVPTQLVRRFKLRAGDHVTGVIRRQRENNDRYAALSYIKTVNGETPEKMMKRPHFDRLTAIYPDERFQLETARNELATRIIDLMAPIGKGQRGLIVSPPKAGKTILLQKIANAVSANNPETHLIVLLIDERPEEVTDMQRSIQGEVVYSTFDKTPENHVKITELVLERAMRLVELGQDVMILTDSLTRMARAYNLTINPTGRTLSGGIDPGALNGPKRFFGAARNIENGGSLTIVATALVETGSRMDEVIFEEFKGTGNMEVYLDRKLSEKRIFPAIDINRSGTRREEKLLAPRALDAVWAIRKAFGQLDSGNVTETIMNLLLKSNDNQRFVESINATLGNKANLDATRSALPGATAARSNNVNNRSASYHNSAKGDYER